MNKRMRGGISHHVLSRSAHVAGVLLMATALTACGGGDNGTPLGSIGSGNGGSQPLTPVGSANGSEPSNPLAPLGPSRPPVGFGGGAPQTASVTCKDYNFQDTTVAPKTVTIYNNSGRTIYPVLTTSPNGVNEWIQACQRVTTTTPTKLVYKLYVNQGAGIPEDTSVTITLPLYSELPSGSTDKYITWWNGGRVILADKDTRLLNTQTTDPNAKDTKMATPAAVTCQGQGTSCQLTTYWSKNQPPVNIYAQLSEYTFGAVNTPDGQNAPLLIPDNVGYNISYVDHVYLPVAIEPASNPYIGYSGSTMDIADFDSAVNNFLMPNGVDNGWPVYNLAEPRHKLPGGYNIFAERTGRETAASDMPVRPTSGDPYTLTTMTCINKAKTGAQCSDTEQAKPYGAAVQSMQDLWGYCVNWGTDTTWKQYVSDPNVDPAVACKAGPTMKSDLQLIHDFFAANYKIYNDTAYPGPGCARIAAQVPFDFFQAMKHIYGWVPFNDECKNAALNPLSATTVDFNGKTWTHAQVQPLYINDLQYNYKISGNTDPIFNPYVKLIHQDLEMNAYGFSVDDSVGFMTELGSGLIFAVGSANGLPNPGQFSYADGFTVALGDPPVPFNKPVIKSYGVCVYPAGKVDSTQCRNIKQDVIMPTETKTVAFRIGTISGYPLRVSFTDLNDNVYSFDVVAKFIPPANPDPTKTNFDPANKQAIQDGVFADCTITNGNQPPDPTKVNNWCHGANPNMASDGTKDPQTVKNFMSFPMPVNFLP